MMDLRGEVECGRRALSAEKERSCWFEGRVKELERAIKEFEDKSNKQYAVIQQWEKRESEHKARERCTRISERKLSTRRRYELR